MEPEMIDRLLSTAEQCRNDERALMLIVEQLEQSVREHGSPEQRYACAYAWYLHPRRLTDNTIWQRIDELLRNVISIVPEDYLSLLYLGHNNYDRGFYSDAKSYFERARRVAPRSYIGLKAYEMVVCCELMTRGLGNAVNEFKVFVDEASRHYYATEDIWPRELARALQQVSPNDGDSPEQFVEAVHLAERLDGLASLKWIEPLVCGLELAGRPHRGDSAV
jgi:tetratricopeptide (TPR) repeat protein